MNEHDQSREEHLKEELSRPLDFEETAIETMEGAIREGGEGFLGHPPGLFLLFVTEMWERFSYYGMRALLTLYMIAEIAGNGVGGVGGGLGLDRSEVGKIYGWYTSLVYLTPIFGGMLADKLIGTHRSMVIGGIIIALGHGALAMIDLFRAEGGTEVALMQNVAFFTGLGLIIIGTGFFKPCVSVMVGQLYKEGDPRRDAGFTIFYMGINLGAALSAIVCGWLASAYGWWAGFGAAGIGMVLGLIVYFVGRPKLLKGIGLPPTERERTGIVLGKVIGAIAIVGALVGGYVLAKGAGFGGYYLVAGLLAALIGIVAFVRMQIPEERGPTAALFIIAFFVVFFWLAFEQAGTSMNVFAQQRTDRSYPWSQTDADGRIETGNLGESVYGGMEMTLLALDAAVDGSAAPAAPGGDEDGDADGSVEEIEGNPFNNGAGTIAITQKNGNSFVIEATPDRTIGWLADQINSRSNGAVRLSENDDGNGLVLVDSTQGGALTIADQRGSIARDLRLLSAAEFPAAWYQSVNAVCILIFAPIFAWLWVRLAKVGKEPHTAIKMGYGLLMLGMGFVFMVLAAKFSDGGFFIAPGENETPDGEAQLARVAAMWLVGAYVLHTWGELCLSPIGLSLTTKLAPRKWVSFMMGVWFLSPSIAQLIGGYTFAYIEPIERGESIMGKVIGGQADFFLVFVITSIGAGLVMLLVSPLLKKLMKGHE